MLAPTRLRVAVTSGAMVAAGNTVRKDPSWPLREAARQGGRSPFGWPEMSDADVVKMLRVLPPLVDEATAILATIERERKAMAAAEKAPKAKHERVLERLATIRDVYGRDMTAQEIGAWARHQIIGSDYGDVSREHVRPSQWVRDAHGRALPPAATDGDGWRRPLPSPSRWLAEEILSEDSETAEAGGGTDMQHSLAVADTESAESIPSNGVEKADDDATGVSAAAVADLLEPRTR